MTQAHCFHCQDEVPSGVDIRIDVGGESQPMCCHGCAAAAAFIAGAGLAQFYRHRAPDAEASLRPPEASYDAFDQPDVAAQYVACDEQGGAEATLYIGDLYCPACIWLINELLDDQPGIQSVAANPASRRIVVHWQADKLGLGAILQRIASAGFKPEPVVPGTRMRAERDDYRTAIKRMLVAGVFGMQAMMFAIGLYAGEFQGIDASTAQLLRVVSLIVTLPIIGYSATPFFRGAWLGLKRRAPGMDVPVALALSVAFVASAIATMRGEGAVYFDSIAMFVALLCVSRFLEMRARHKADDGAEAMASMLPASVRRVVDGTTSERIAREAIRSNDHLQLCNGDIIAADGVVISGTLTVDESMMTGESEPLTRRSGDPVLAGTTVCSGEAVIEARQTGAATQLGEIARLIERAQTDRGALQTASDKVASIFVVSVLAIAAATALVWWQLAPARMLPIVLSVLIVACPCALALATPTALASAAGALSRRGLLLIRARLLDRLQRGATIVFDKTGTLTRGTPELTDTRVSVGARPTAQQCREIAAALEADSGHVLARAFLPYRNADCTLDDKPVIHVGEGVSGTINGRAYRIGKREFVAGAAGENIGCSDTSGGIYLGDNTGVLCEFTVRDPLRRDARETLDWLQDRGFRTLIASGDQQAVVARIAGELGISDFHADQTPASKLALVRRLREDGSHVIMVGDGVNDAPVLAAADASIAIGSGAALARSSADGILLGKDLGPLRDLARISRKSRRVIHQSLGWAAFYNLLGVSLAALGFVAPWMAAIGMSASSLLVVGNALRIDRQLPADINEQRRADPVEAMS